VAKLRNENDIGVLDFETDPFLAGRIPHPFAACIYFAPTDYAMLWESDSKREFIARVVEALRMLPTCILYAHNGGRFDFHYLVESADFGSIVIRNGRIAEMRIGRVTLKDSFPLMPFALEEYKKTKIDYSIFERNRRNKPTNRKKITSYLYDDCKFLRELIIGFRAVAGPKDTIGGCAFYQMRQMGLDIHSLNETHDDMFRRFYFGGRVQAFSHGIHDGKFRYLDINSAYPFAMLQRHAHGPEYEVRKELPHLRAIGNTFVQCVALSKGALPLRAQDGSLSFPHGEFEFDCTGWEIAAGLETGTVEIRRVLNVWIPKSFICFDEYVQTFFALRQKAKDDGDEIKRLAYKYLLNSGYGKFAQNPREFKEYHLEAYGYDVPGFEWETDYGAVSLWSRPTYKGFGFYDVATGASITGFVRAMLWRAICASRNVLYCDTDALICEESSVPMGDELGRWKLEGMLDRAAIAGKKLYGVQWDKETFAKLKKKNPTVARQKIASKGARLTWKEMLSLCDGDEILWKNEAPTFSISGAQFIKRRINGKEGTPLAHMTTIYVVVSAGVSEQSLLSECAAKFQKCVSEIHMPKKKLRIVFLSASDRSILGIAKPQTLKAKLIETILGKEAKRYKAPEIFKQFSLQ